MFSIVNRPVVEFLSTITFRVSWTWCKNIKINQFLSELSTTINLEQIAEICLKESVHLFWSIEFQVNAMRSHFVNKWRTFWNQNHINSICYYIFIYCITFVVWARPSQTINFCRDWILGENNTHKFMFAWV